MALFSLNFSLLWVESHSTEEIKWNGCNLLKCQKIQDVDVDVTVNDIWFSCCSIPIDPPCVSCLKICKVIIGHQRAEDCVYSALYNPFPLLAQLWNCLIRMIKTILSPLLTGFILKCSPNSRFVCFKIVAPDSWHILCVLARQTRHLQNNKYETKLPYNWTKTKTYWTYTKNFGW